MPRLPEVGDLFGRYRIEALIGSGGMGAVYLAGDPRLGRKVALKVVNRIGEGDEFVRRFEREAAVLASLDSPHVIAVYDYGEENGQPYIVTQYVAGGDLGDLIRDRGPLSPAVAAMICAQVAAALADAHEAGIVHRDVKPANILLRDPGDPEESVLLCDFGVARTHSDGLTTPGSVTGTWAYLAPECGRGEPATAASDLYALGCLLWTCLTGTPPYTGSDVEIAIAHQQQPVPQLPATFPGADRLNPVLARMLAKSPSDRYADAELCRDDLERLANELHAGPADAETAPAAYGTAGDTVARAAPPSRRRRALLAGATALVIVVAGGVALAVTRPWAGATAPKHTHANQTNRTNQPITGDVDGDRKGDVILLSGPGERQSLSVWSSGTKTLGKPQSFAGNSFKIVPRYADVDGDGRPELVTLTGGVKINGTPQVHATATLSGGGRLDTTLPLPPGYPGVNLYLVQPQFADLDGDRRSDVLDTSWEYDKIPTSTSAYWTQLNTGSGWAKPTKTVPIDYPDKTFHLSAIGDFDGDGKDDLAEVNQTDPYSTKGEKLLKQGDGKLPATLIVYRSTGTALVKTGSHKLMEYPLQDLDAADIDGDGRDELVLAAKTPDESDLLRITSVAKGHPGAPHDGPTIEGTGDDFGSGHYTVSDLDGDGTDDIIHATDRSDGKIRLQACYSDGQRLKAPTNLAVIGGKAVKGASLQRPTW